jgi:predicted transcriptional regulator
MPSPIIDPSVFKRLARVLKTPKTIDQIAEVLKVSRRTVYRYLSRMAEDGVLLSASLTRPTKYHILQK